MSPDAFYVDWQRLKLNTFIIIYILIYFSIVSKKHIFSFFLILVLSFI